MLWKTRKWLPHMYVNMTSLSTMTMMHIPRNGNNAWHWFPLAGWGEAQTKMMSLWWSDAGSDHRDVTCDVAADVMHVKALSAWPILHMLLFELIRTFTCGQSIQYDNARMGHHVLAISSQTQDSIISSEKKRIFPWSERWERIAKVFIFLIRILFFRSAV